MRSVGRKKVLMVWGDQIILSTQGKTFIAIFILPSQGLHMVSYRPLGVTILAAIIILVYSVIFIAGLFLLIFGISTIPFMGGEGALKGENILILILGIILLIWAFVRLSMGFGLLRMRRRAWKSAMIVFVLGLLIDLVIAPPQVLLDIIIIIYLIIVKNEFIY